MPTITYLEKHDDDAVTNFSFDMTGGSARGYYHVVLNSFPDGSELQQAVTEILGTTNILGTGDQFLQRIIPKTHPKFPYLYASKIVSMVGKGVGTALVVNPTYPVNASIGVNPIANFELFREYEIGVDFTSRLYPILADGAFSPTVNSTYVPRTGGAPIAFSYSPEWVRYVNIDQFVQDNTIQGQTGSLELIISGSNHIPFTSPPWMWLPDQLVRVTWYQVPLRLIQSANSYIANRGWRGRINQNAWNNYPAGSLLYLGYNYKKYTPPTLLIETVPTVPPNPNFVNSIRYGQLCDIELNFLFTSRYMSGSLGGSITNGNYVAAGHNLLPNLADQNFYYSTRNGTSFSLNNPPAWSSFPLELCFSDCDFGTVVFPGDN